MISVEQRAEIRRLFYAEHWKVGTIASALSVHADTVRRAIEAERFFANTARPRPTKLDELLPFIRETLASYLCAAETPRAASEHEVWTCHAATRIRVERAQQHEAGSRDADLDTPDAKEGSTRLRCRRSTVHPFASCRRERSSELP